MRRPALALLLFNLIAVYVLWGSTAPAIRVAVATLPPFYMAGVRFLIAGALLWGFVRFRSAPLPKRVEWTGAAITGFTLLVLGNGVFVWTLQYLPSSIGALFFSLAPFFIALFAFGLERERLSALGAAGVVLGLAGMVYLVVPSGSSSLPLVPIAAAFFSAVAWGLGSVLQRRYPARDVVQASAMQMLVAGAVLVVLGAVSSERVTPASLTPHAVMAVLYLIAFGSIVGYSCYLWLMRNVSTTLASTYAYVNPIVAIAISVTLLHEQLTLHTVIAATVIVAGVALMALAPKPTVGPGLERPGINEDLVRLESA
jgi:drug/metabolite transporter (DMT)-like permease